MFVGEGLSVCGRGFKCLWERVQVFVGEGLSVYGRGFKCLRERV